MLRSPGLGARVTWASLEGKPSTFAPAAHTHPWADVTGKPVTYPPATHTHLWADITDRPAVPVLLGTITIAETATIAITAGIRRVSITTPTAWNIKAGDDIAVFAATLPSTAYALHDVVVTGPNTITVGVSAPLLAVGAGYSITAQVRRFT